MSDDERAYTYRELGELLGIAPDSARTRAQRSGWRVTRDNRGVARVHVPPGELPDLRRALPPRAPEARGADRPARGADPGQGALMAELARVLEDVRRLRDRAEAVRASEAEARIGLARARAQVEALEESHRVGMEAVRRGHAAEVGALRRQIEVEAAARNAVIEEMRAMLREARKPFWRRWTGR